MEEEEFRIPLSEEDLDFAKLPLWEATIIHAYLTVFDDKINVFVKALYRIHEEFTEKYRMEPTQVKSEEIKETDRVKWQSDIMNAIRLFYGWGSVSLSDFEQLLKGLSSKVKGWLNQQIADAIKWLTNKLLNFFKNFASHLKVQGWNVSGSFGFTGLAISIGINFDPV